MYSSSNILQTGERVENNNIKFKNVFDERLHFLLNNILISNNNLDGILNRSLLIDEDIIVLFTDLRPQSYFIYNQFLKTNCIFKSYFTEDGFKQFESIINSYKCNQTCKKCSVLLNEKDNIKICCDCFLLYHFVCSDKIKSSKKWKCTNC